MLKRILVGVCDPQHTVSATFYARELALRFGAEVTGIAVTDMRHLSNVGSVPVGANSFAKELIQERIEHNEAAIRESFDLLVRQLEESHVKCHVLKQAGNPYEALVDASRYHDLMIFGLRGLFEHGVTDEPPHEVVHLIESGVRPILAVGPSPREVKRVLMAYSGSVESAKTIRNFTNLQLWPDARTKVVHFGSRGGHGPALLTDTRNYLQHHGINVEIELIDDSPKTRLLDHAQDWKADLIVVGNSGKSLLRRRLFGETALKTIGESQLPLFLSQ